jgi:hypothetical protein
VFHFAVLELDIPGCPNGGRFPELESPRLPGHVKIPEKDVEIFL